MDRSRACDELALAFLMDMNSFLNMIIVMHDTRLRD